MRLHIQSTYNTAELGFDSDGEVKGQKIHRGGNSFSLDKWSFDILHFFSEPRAVKCLLQIRNSSCNAAKAVDYLLYLDLITVKSWCRSVRRGVISRPGREAGPPPALNTLLNSTVILFGCATDFAQDPPNSSLSGPYLLRRQFGALSEKYPETDQGDLATFTDEGIYGLGDRISFNTWRARITGKTPIMIGGDHSLSYFAALGCAAVAPITYIQLDAHNDLGLASRSSRQNSLGLHQLNHANFAYRLALRPEIDQIIQIGVRPSEAISSSSLARKTGKITQITSTQFAHANVEEIVKAIDPNTAIYLSVDLDVIDPCFELSVTTPLDNGIDPEKLISFLKNLVGHTSVVGGDIVEFYSSEVAEKRERTSGYINELIQIISER